MQKAVDEVIKSPHPTNKVASSIFGLDQDKKTFSVTATNYWPQIIIDKIGTNTKIGNSSGTIHAETATIFKSPYTNASSIAITDPFCPNCAKNIAEAGIKTIYIDHKGFKKDFWERREHVFINMSMHIVERAGISVYELWRKEEKIIPIFETPDDYIPDNENPVEVNKLDIASKENFIKIINIKSKLHTGRKHAIVLAKDRNNNIFALTARSHPTVGYIYTDIKTKEENPENKYSFILEPLNRLLINAPKKGLKILDKFVYCSQIPTSREQVNMIGAGITKISISNPKKARDSYAFEAMALLKEKNIVHYEIL